jgi:hypothetical protein
MRDGLVILKQIFSILINTGGGRRARRRAALLEHLQASADSGFSTLCGSARLLVLSAINLVLGIRSKLFLLLIQLTTTRQR